MKILQAAKDDLQTVYGIVSATIKEVYPNYYPAEVVDFFANLHCEARILADIKSRNVFLLTTGEEILGTGSVDENHIYRVFVLPAFQGKGYGSFIMDFLEERITQRYLAAVLDASLPAHRLYIKRGYITTSHQQIVTDNNRVLCYPVMQKLLPARQAPAEGIHYGGRVFTTVENSENGEVSGRTVFYYHQEGNLVWADYTGGEIEKGFIIGKVENHVLSFTYQHINNQGLLRMGRCTSTPQILPDGRLRLNERWQWLNDDCSVGHSVVEEPEEKR